jgi:hypothetical protein
MGGTLQLLFRYRPGHRPDIGRLVTAVQQVYTQNNVDVTVRAGADAELNATAMQSVNTSGCHSAVFDHRALFEAVSPISVPNEAVVFVVGSITDGGPFSGCAAHPFDCPGLVITEAAAKGTGLGAAQDGKWVLAHEIAHVLGLDDLTGQKSSLMCAPATAITATLPAISSTERLTMEGSRFLGHGAVRTAGRSNPLPGDAGTGVSPRETPSRSIGGRDTPIFPPRRRRSIFDDFRP